MTQQYSDYLKQYYDKVAGVYDSSYTGVGRYRSNYFRLKILVALLERLLDQPKNILDAGCGDARPLLELLTHGFDVRGFDASDAMLNAGRNILSDAGHDASRIEKGDIYNINAGDHSYDAVVCMGVVEHLPDHPKIFSEFRRVLRARGRLFVSLQNDLFSLFSMNKHSVAYLSMLLAHIHVPLDIREKVIADISRWYQLDSITMLKKKVEDANIDKSGVELASYNPLNINQELKALGFEVEELRFFHYHPLPPRFEVEYPAVFQGIAERLETVEYDPGFPIWLWYFCPFDQSSSLDCRGFLERDQATEGDTQWVNYKRSPFSSRSTDF